MDINKLPNWLRWLLIPIASILAAILTTLLLRAFVWLQSRFLGFGEDAWLELIWRSLFVGGLTGFAAVYVATALAPFRKAVVGLTIGGIFVVLSGISLFLTLSKNNWWESIEILSTIVGVGIAIHKAFKEESNEI